MPWSRRYAIFSVYFLLWLMPLTVLAQSDLDLAPSNPLGLPGTTAGLPRGSDSMYLSGRMLPDLIPSNLEIGYLYSFGDLVESSRLTLDYFLPVFTQDGVIFGEGHSEFQDFFKTVQGGANTRTDVSVGGGYRRVFGNHLILGLNAFYDTTRLSGRWYGSFGFGAEMAALLPGQDAMDLNFNWYANPNNDILASIFREGTGNYDLEAGYSHELYQGGPDLRLKVRGYRFGNPNGVYGWLGGAELKSRDGIFSLKYEGGHDRSTGTYHTVGGYVNIGLQLENLIAGESPFVMPEPIFRSPRNIRKMLASKVKRSWLQGAPPGSGGAMMCPANECEQRYTVVATRHLMLPARMADGEQRCIDVSPFVWDTNNCQWDTTRAGTEGTLYFRAYTAPCEAGSQIDPTGRIVDGQTSGCNSDSWYTYTVQSIRVTCYAGSTTGCDAGCITSVFEGR